MCMAKLRENGQPEFRALGVLDPQAQNVLFSVGTEAHHTVHGLVPNDALVTEFYKQGIEIDDQIDRVQGT